MGVLIISSLVVLVLVFILILMPKASYKENPNGIGQIFKKKK